MTTTTEGLPLPIAFSKAKDAIIRNIGGFKCYEILSPDGKREFAYYSYREDVLENEETITLNRDMLVLNNVVVDTHRGLSPRIVRSEPASVHFVPLMGVCKTTRPDNTQELEIWLAVKGHDDNIAEVIYGDKGIRSEKITLRSYPPINNSPLGHLLDDLPSLDKLPERIDVNATVQGFVAQLNALNFGSPNLVPTSQSA